MRRYELMLVIRPDAPDDRIAAIVDRATGQITADGGQIIKVAPWGRRRLAYPIDGHREGSNHIVLFEGAAGTIAELERTLMITEEVLRHLVIRQDRPTRARRDDGSEDLDDTDLPPADGDDQDDESERIDESESEAAPAAID